MTSLNTVTLSRDTFDTMRDNAEAAYVLADEIETKLMRLFDLTDNPILLQDKTTMLGMALAIKQLTDPLVTTVELD